MLLTKWEMIDLAILLLGFFVLFGIAFIGVGIWVMVRMYGKHSVEVDAECVDISVTTETTGVRPADYTHYMNVKRPVYRYWYDGKQYEGMPFLSSNRPGYRRLLDHAKFESTLISLKKFILLSGSLLRHSLLVLAFCT